MIAYSIDNQAFECCNTKEKVMAQKRPAIIAGLIKLCDFVLELKAVLEGCCLVEDEVVRSAVVVLEEVAYAFELNCNA